MSKVLVPAVLTSGQWRPRASLVVAALAVAALLVPPGPAGATSLERLSIDELSARAATVVEGTVLSTRSESAADGVRTAVDVGVDESLKGRGGPTKTVYVPGGALADGSRVVVDGMPAFVAGEKCFVFADKNDWVMGGYQGKITVADGAGSASSDAEPASLVDREVRSALGLPVPLQSMLRPIALAGVPMRVSLPPSRSRALSSMAPQPLNISGTTWVSDGFESGSLTGWVQSSPVTWGITTYRACAGLRSLYSGGSTGGATSYPANAGYYVIKGPYNLSGATGQASLKADIWLDTQAANDWAGLFVSTDGANFEGNVWSGTYRYWSPVSLDLANVSGGDGITHTCRTRPSCGSQSGSHRMPRSTPTKAPASTTSHSPTTPQLSRASHPPRRRRASTRTSRSLAPGLARPPAASGSRTDEMG